MELSEMTMFSDDVETMADYWETMLGTEPFARHPGIAMFDAAGVTVLIHETVEEDGDGPPNEDHFAFEVDDVDETYADLLEAGLEGFMEPDDYQWGRSAYLRDPDGRLIELAE